MRGEAVHGRFACRGVQRQVRRGRRGLHEQGLGQLALLLLDLLLQVSDCTCDLEADTCMLGGSDVVYHLCVCLHCIYARADLLPRLGDPKIVKGGSVGETRGNRIAHHLSAPGAGRLGLRDPQAGGTHLLLLLSHGSGHIPLGL